MVTIPTIDQISGTTVMNKMRSLIHAFINFATGIDDEITEFENTVTQDFYTKLEVDTKFADYYTKSQIDSGWYTKFEIQNEVLVDYYTKTQIDTTIAGYYTKTETDALLDDKQDVLTAGTNITIENNVISATGEGSGSEITFFDSLPNLVTEGILDSNGILLKDLIVDAYFNRYGARVQGRHIFFAGTKVVDNQASSFGFTLNSGSGYIQYFNYFSLAYMNNTTSAYAYSMETSLSTGASYYTLKIYESSIVQATYDKNLTMPANNGNKVTYRVGVYE